MSSVTDNLNDLISVASDGIEFYEHAADSVNAARLKAVFRSMAKVKRDLVTGLGVEVRARGDRPDDGGTVAGGLRRVYTKLRARLASDPAATWVSELEEHEDRLLEAFEDVMAQNTDPPAVEVLRRHLPRIRACHDEMRRIEKIFT